MNNAHGEDKDMKSYSVYELLVAGSRFTDDYDEDDAVEHFLKLHPEADPVAVRAELVASLGRSNTSGL